MQITHVKDLSIYASKRISEYEFQRMDGVERTYKIACFGLFIAPALVWGMLLARKPNLEASRAIGIPSVKQVSPTVIDDYVDTSYGDLEAPKPFRTVDCGWKKC